MQWDISAEEVYRAEWVIEGVLARCHRPGYPANRPAQETIRAWADAVLELGIRSVVCVLDQEQISRYGRLGLDGGGLLGYYRTLGLTVEHILAEDYQTPPLSAEQLDRAWRAFQGLDKPVLVHCSAGRDRTGAAVAHIVSRLDGDAE